MQPTPRHLRRRARSNKAEHEDSPVDIKRIESFQLGKADQSQSVFFTDLPGEVRDIIYEYVLADFEDMDRPYSIHTCFRRPEYYAPRKTDTALLRTCQEVYAEAWYLPWTSARHTFYLTEHGRKPTKTTTVEQMTNMLALIDKLHPHTSNRRKEVHQIQVFAQACHLEPGHRLNEILQIPYLLPKTVTITLRHTDMWFWESDTPIRLTPNFVRKAQLPVSVLRVEMQFESLERRKAQIDYIADRASKEWHYKRTDNIHLISQQSPNIVKWIGSSTWENRRWIRDEDENLPGKLQYYMATIVFTPAHEQDDKEGYEKREHMKDPCSPIEVPAEVAKQNRRDVNEASFDIRLLEPLGITDETTPSEVNRLISEKREKERREWRHGRGIYGLRRLQPPLPSPLPVARLPTGEPYIDSAEP